MPVLRQSESTFKPVPAGVHVARCYAMVSLGTQQPMNPQFQPQFKVVLCFEFPNEQIDVAGAKKPMMTSHFVNAYLGRPNKPSKTTLFLTAWRGRPFTDAEFTAFDLKQVVGAPCLLNIVHEEKNGKVRETIASVSPLPKEMKDTVAPMFNEKIIFEIEDGKNEVYQKLPEWMQKMIQASDEWTHPAERAQDDAPRDADAQADADADSVPF